MFVNCKLVSAMTVTPPHFYCNQNYSGWQFYLPIFGYITSMPQDLNNYKKNSLIPSYYWFLLKSYHIILMDGSLWFRGLEDSFNESWIKFSDKSLWFKWLRHFLLALFYWIFGFCLFLLLFS